MKIDREAEVGPVRLRYSRRTADETWGRFGGGWQWKIGVQASKRTAVVSLLVCEVVIQRHQRCEVCGQRWADASPMFVRRGYLYLCPECKRSPIEP